MDAATGTVGAPSRIPRQGRSRASFERMMDAAERLLRDRGTDDFTLSEVSKLGKVSIGSIYCRFDSKDDLIRAIQERVVTQVMGEQLSAITTAAEADLELPILIARLVEGFAEPLREYAPLLRPLMLRAAADPIVAAAGRESYLTVADAVERAVLKQGEAITHPNPPRAAAAMFRIAYSAIARFLGFGSPAGQREDVMRWHELKEDLVVMCTAFLMVQPECTKHWAQLKER